MREDFSAITCLKNLNVSSASLSFSPETESGTGTAGTISQRAQRSKTFEISIEIEISSENEIFERATDRGPIFCGEIETSRLTFSIKIEISIEI